MSDQRLRAAVIRLAHEHPELRDTLLPLVREAATEREAVVQARVVVADYLRWLQAVVTDLDEGMSYGVNDELDRAIASNLHELLQATTALARVLPLEDGPAVGDEYRALAAQFRAGLRRI